MPLPLETWGARPDEIHAPMPGDELIDDPPMSATRAIDLGCSPDEAFGWLTQMGFGRAGWYSYDLIDNLGRRSATRIHPGWQVTSAGDPVPGGPVDFTASIIDPPEAFVLSLLDQHLAGHRIDFTLAFHLTLVGSRPVGATGDEDPLGEVAAEPAPGANAGHADTEPTPTGDGAPSPAGSEDRTQPGPDTRTRLASRARARVDGPLGRVLVPMLCLGDGVMVRRQLLGLQRRCGV